MSTPSKARPPRLTHQMIVDSAIALARDEQPGDQLSALEGRLISEANLDVREIVFEMNALIDAARRAFDSAHRFLPDNITLRTRVEPYYTSFRQALPAHRPLVTRACFEEQAAKRNFVAFYRRNKLLAPALYPTHPTAFWASHTIVAFLFESGTCILLFADQVETGVGGAFGISCSVSFVSLTLAYTGAQLTRNCLHRSRARRVCGGVGVAAMAGLLFILHTTYAQFRTLLRDDTSATFGQTLNVVFSTAALNLNFQGMLLLLIGLAVSAAVWMRIFQSSTAYPGYAEQDRAVRESQRKADGARTVLLPVRVELMAAARNSTGELLACAETALKRMTAALAQIAAAEEAARHRLSAVQDQLAEASAIFWRENVAGRTGPLPGRAHEPLSVDITVTPQHTAGLDAQLHEAELRLPVLQADAVTLLRGFDGWMELASETFHSEIEEAAKSLRDVPRARVRLGHAAAPGAGQVKTALFALVISAALIAPTAACSMPRQTTALAQRGAAGCTAILIDTTDPHSGAQRAAVNRKLHALAHDLRRGERWAFYGLSGASRSPQELGTGTSPGSGAEANAWTEGSAFMERRFRVEVIGQLDSLLAATAVDNSSAMSPILEAIWQITRLSECATGTGLRRLVVISDLVHNTDSFSFYRGDKSFFTPAGELRDPKWSADLKGAAVEVWWIQRDRDAALQGPQMVAAYTRYFKARGAGSVHFTAVTP